MRAGCQYRMNRLIVGRGPGAAQNCCLTPPGQSQLIKITQPTRDPRLSVSTDAGVCSPDSFVPQAQFFTQRGRVCGSIANLPCRRLPGGFQCYPSRIRQ